MKASKKAKLEKAGWSVSSVDEFLGLSPEESDYVEMKVALAQKLHSTRIKKQISQVTFAKMIHSSQSRVAKMEKHDPSVSMDLLIRSLLVLGNSRKEVARALG